MHRMNGLVGIVQLIRPGQWIKNCILFVAVLFSPAKVLLETPAALLYAFEGFCVFCLLSSAVYAFNDLIDLEADRQHPRKQSRPLPAGKIKPTTAIVVAIFSAAAGLVWSFLLPTGFGWIAVAYLITNLVYTLGFKRMVVLDVLLLSFGFVYRAVAGVVVISPLLPQVYISYWLILCAFLLSLFLALAKRRHEISVLGDAASLHRASLANYSLPLIDQMLSTLAAATLVSYCLYTISEETVAHYGTSNLFWTIPFVVYGLFRYLYLIHLRGGGGDPTAALVRDKATLLNVALWGLTSAGIVYFR